MTRHFISTNPNDEPAAVLAMLDAAVGNPPTWGPDDLSAVLQQELNIPIRVALGTSGPELDQLEPDARAAVPVNLRTLFSQQPPAPAVLHVVKRFAKQCCGSEQAGLPREVGLMLYYASIAAGRLRCGMAMSELPDQALRMGWKWAATRPWADASLRTLLREAITQIGGWPSDERDASEPPCPP